jgi:hydrogenase expression/formation protein HypD
LARLDQRRETRDLLDRLAAWQGRSLTFMEVCGTHTVAAARAGLHSLFPSTIHLISGPGCPVCVTPVGYVDHALSLCAIEKITLVTFGDLMRVPGSCGASASGIPPSLEVARARGADVRVVYSPSDALDLARTRREREVVFLGVGFETTTPAIAASILQAEREGIHNFSVLSANKTIIPAMEALGTSGETAIDGFLCPGHVSVIIGAEAYRDLVERHRLRCAIAGFEPVEILRAIAALTDQVARDEARLDNCYPGVVRPEGNPRAREIMHRVFEPCDSNWRGLGTIPMSGLQLHSEYRAHDAAQRFPLDIPPPVEPPGCRCGDVLRGALAPEDCALFGRVCTPETPSGACMVSSEGSCAAHYCYGRQDIL